MRFTAYHREAVPSHSNTVQCRSRLCRCSSWLSVLSVGCNAFAVLVNAERSELCSAFAFLCGAVCAVHFPAFALRSCAAPGHAMPSLRESLPRLAVAMPFCARLLGTMPLQGISVLRYAPPIHAFARPFHSLPFHATARLLWAELCLCNAAPFRSVPGLAVARLSLTSP